MTEPRDLPDDLAEIASHIPQDPRGLGPLRTLLTLLRPPLGTTRVGAGLEILDDPQQAAVQAGAADYASSGDPPFGSITGNAIQKDSITAQQIKADTITAAEIAAGTITASELAAGSVTTDQLSVGGAGANVPITDPGFEHGGQNWAGTGWYVEAADASGHTGFAGGSRCTIYKDPGLPYAYLDQRYFPIRNGEVIRISALMKASASPITARFQVVCMDKNAVELGFPQTDVTVGTAGTARYGGSIQVVGGPTVVFGAFRIFNITNGTWLMVDDVVVSRATALITDDGNVTLDTSGITVYNGKIVVRNPGSTVIIDGTSDIFKVAATGQLAPANFTGPGVSGANVTIATGLAYTPACSGYVQTGGGNYPLFYCAWNVYTGTILDSMEIWTTAVAGPSTRVNVQQNTSRTGSVAGLTVRYYVFSEAAL